MPKRLIAKDIPRSPGCFGLRPGATHFLMDIEPVLEHEGSVLWTPLSVVYTDFREVTGSVYALWASMDLSSRQASFVRADMVGIMNIARKDEHVVLADPYSNRILTKIPASDSRKVMLNSWHLFCGGIYPMLRSETYRFPLETERFAFQHTMIALITKLYEDLL